MSSTPTGVDETALATAHLAVENVLADMRDRRISVLARNGFVILERDGSESCAMRLSTRDGLRVGIRAYLDTLAAQE